MTEDTFHDKADRVFTRRRFIQSVGAALCACTLPSVWAAENDLQATRKAAGGANWKEPKVRGSGWLEWRLAPPPGWNALKSNPFNPSVADMWVEFTGPDGRNLRATAFWIQDRLGSGWAVRLLPHMSGNWNAVSKGRFGGGDPVAVGNPFSFKVGKVPAHQKVVIDPRHPGYFAFEDGSPYVPIGINLGWALSSPADDYDHWFKQLAENGGNFARIWMASWGFGLEWKDTRLGNYSARLDRAEQLDQVFELAEKYNIRIMLCLVNHGAFSEKTNPEWKDNPYNKINGGPLTHPEEFVTDLKALELFARRVRYIAARWSHSPALHSWEWWNEVNWTPIYDDELVPWIHDMSLVLDRHDPYRRLRSTSWSDRGAANIWAMPEMDFAQQHDYTNMDLSLHYAAGYRDFRADVPVKPLLPGELGLEGSYDANIKHPYNWDAVHLHNGLWAPIFRGYAGTGMYWWWDTLVDPLKLWSTYKGISNFVNAVQTKGRIAAHRPRPAQLTGGKATALALAGKNSVLLWVRSDLHDVSALQAAYGEADPASPAFRTWQPNWTPVTGAKVKCAVPGAADGTAQVRWMDTHSGEWLAQAPSSGWIRGGMLSVDCPAFERDVAAIVTL